MINCVIMAGGKGSRLGNINKPMINICGSPIIIHIVTTIKNLCKNIVIAYSKYTKNIAEILCSNDLCGKCICIETSGEDYINDLNKAFMQTRFPILVLPSDTPFIDKDILEDFIFKALDSSYEICNLYVSGRGLIGVSLFRSRSGRWINIEYKYRDTLIDIDNSRDLEIARVLCNEISRR